MPAGLQDVGKKDGEETKREEGERERERKREGVMKDGENGGIANNKQAC